MTTRNSVRIDSVVTFLYDVGQGKITTSEFAMTGSQIEKGSSPSIALNMRVKPATRNLIDRAAEILGKSRTDFILEASERRAEQVLLERTVFAVSPEVYATYLDLLDAPPASNPKLVRTMTTKAPWDEK
jgi:uncharacterized protein (DUF1778 family)